MKDSPSKTRTSFTAKLLPVASTVSARPDHQAMPPNAAARQASTPISWIFFITALPAPNLSYAAAARRLRASTANTAVTSNKAATCNPTACPASPPTTFNASCERW